MTHERPPGTALVGPSRPGLRVPAIPLGYPARINGSAGKPGNRGEACRRPFVLLRGRVLP
jgi:hypothetical protein